MLGSDDSSINVLELLGMIVKAYIFVADDTLLHEIDSQSFLLRGGNMSAIHCCKRYRGPRESRSGAPVMLMLGCLDRRAEVLKHDT